MIAFVNSDRRSRSQYRRHATRAFLTLRPAGAEVKTGLAAVIADGGFDAVVDGLALSVCEQDAVVGIADPTVEAGDFFTGDAQEQLGALAAFLQHVLREDPWSL